MSQTESSKWEPGMDKASWDHFQGVEWTDLMSATKGVVLHLRKFEHSEDWSRDRRMLQPENAIQYLENTPNKLEAFALSSYSKLRMECPKVTQTSKPLFDHFLAFQNYQKIVGSSHCTIEQRMEGFEQMSDSLLGLRHEAALAMRGGGRKRNATRYPSWPVSDDDMDKFDGYVDAVQKFISHSHLIEITDQDRVQAAIREIDGIESLFTTFAETIEGYQYPSVPIEDTPRSLTALFHSSKLYFQISPNSSHTVEQRLKADARFNRDLQAIKTYMEDSLAEPSAASKDLSIHNLSIH